MDDKLQGSVATYLRCGGVANNQIKLVLLLSLSVVTFQKSVNIWQSYKQERGCLVQFVHLANTLHLLPHLNPDRFYLSGTSLPTDV